MINLAVINIKDVIKLIKKILCIAFAIIIIIFILKKVEFNIESLKPKTIFRSQIIDKNILLANYYNNGLDKKESGLKKILVSELALFSKEEELMEKENQEEVLEFENNDVTDNKNINSEKNVNEEKKDISLEEISENMSKVQPVLETKVIKENNKTDTFTNTYKSVKIRNESSYNLTEEMLIPNVELKNKKDIIIYHTHTCESYTPTEANNYVASGNFRTIDLNYSVARVGTELANNLLSLGFNVNHDKTYHDYPAYTGSYTRSLSTIKKDLEKTPNSEFIIDLHRDAIGSMSNYGPSVQIGDEVVAQVMFVIGTDGGGLEHKDWLYNFKMAVKIQEKANEMYPGLFKPIILRNSRYNQHVTKGACIIEVGATGNTLEQCNASMKYLAKVIEEVLK